VHFAFILISLGIIGNRALQCQNLTNILNAFLTEKNHSRCGVIEKAFQCLLVQIKLALASKYSLNETSSYPFSTIRRGKQKYRWYLLNAGV